MHYLHKILVHIPTATDVDADTPREQILKDVISHAKSETECFYERAFDWREDDSAGRWSDTYPQQAYIASDDLEWFINELVDVQNQQKYEIDNCLHRIREAAGTDLVVLSDKLWRRESVSYEIKNGITEMTAYYLRCLAQHLYGEYRCDSCFYNTKDYTARLYKSDFDTIRENPNEWALVMFDYHN